MAYCNTTSDLVAVYPKIDHFQFNEILEDFTQDSTYTSTYKKSRVGYAGQVFENTKQLTEQSSVSDVNSNAGSFYYDTDTDILYVHTTNSNDPSNYDIFYGEDWDALKSSANNQAHEMLDSMLGHVMKVPIEPRMRKYHGTADYDYPIVRACALLTCYILVDRIDSEEAQKIYDRVSNGDRTGIVDKILDGKIHIEDQITHTEPGGWNVIEKSSSSGYIKITGKYTGSQKQLWELKIDTAGAPGTATWKLSKDGGSTYSPTEQNTRDDDNVNLRVSIGSGLYVEFYGTFVEDDYFKFIVYPIETISSTGRLSSLEIIR